uniref:Transmembrane protein n=1 Tax=Panagrellus redivivus TaxID=6233 RepID=A0A7E4UL37_PANRE
MLKMMYKFSLLKAAFDGWGDLNPVWQAVLRVDDIVNKRQHAYARDTLVLHCDSTNSYEKIIPFICGPYTRLVLHGNINVDQVKRLANSNVKKVRISAILDLLEEDYDDFVEFISKHCSSGNKCFALCRNESLTSEFIDQLEENFSRKEFYCRPNCCTEDKKKVRVGSVKNFHYYPLVCLGLLLAVYPFAFMLLGINIVDMHTIGIWLMTYACILSFTLGLMLFCPKIVPQTDTMDPSVVQTNDLSDLCHAIIRALWAIIDTKLLKMCDFVEYVYDKVMF